MNTSGWKALIDVDPAVEGGRPVVKGTRVPLYVLVGEVAAGSTIGATAEAYSVTAREVQGALLFAAHNLQRRRGRSPEIAESDVHA
jgi:uncharacterized protein (DUF433 family)